MKQLRIKLNQYEASYFIYIVVLYFFSITILFNRAQAFSPIQQILRKPSDTSKGGLSTFHISQAAPSPGRSFLRESDSDYLTSDDDDLLLESWGRNQEWALQDNISKYTVNIPTLKTSLDISGVTYAMWRSMARDIVELSGFDVQFIRKMHAKQLKEADVTDEGSSPGILPLLDEFEFRPNGGVSGRIQGLRGISDGTVVETSPLAQVDLTIPKGYIVTDDGSAAYELGLPLSEGLSSISQYARDTGMASAKFGNNAMNGVDGTISNFVDNSDVALMANLGKTTAIALGGAMALNLLSHHLTINVFWV